MVKALQELGGLQCSLDMSMFYWRQDGHLDGMLCLHVDDILYCGSQNFNDTIITSLQKQFRVGSSAEASFTYLGVDFKSYTDGITVDQKQYISSISPSPITMARQSNKDSCLSVQEIADFRSLVGQLNWVATQTRPDVAFDTCELGVSISKAVVSDLLHLNKVVGGLNKTLYSYFFLECYTDAAFANLSNDGSQGAMLIFLRDSDGKRFPIFWKTRCLRRTPRSTLEAETLALVEVAEASVYLANILTQITGRKSITVRCLVDNRSLYDSIYSTRQVDNKKLRMDVKAVKNMLVSGEINRVDWVEGSQQLADCLTKKGVSPNKLRAAIGR
ncbi:unnamed protein product [Meganyctiphanes norvegica]|uniref:Reverse transcriptase Ty1/copia-type domain-containing protein n=1 Tax=Meganyctiphanes norvegica TaxID=48144 RepID=A0AAV2RS79_MEGNR